MSKNSVPRTGFSPAMASATFTARSASGAARSGKPVSKRTTVRYPATRSSARRDAHPRSHARIDPALILMLDHIERIPEFAPAFPADTLALLDASREWPAVVPRLRTGRGAHSGCRATHRKEGLRLVPLAGHGTPPLRRRDRCPHRSGRPRYRQERFAPPDSNRDRQRSAHDACVSRRATSRSRGVAPSSAIRDMNAASARCATLATLVQVLHRPNPFRVFAGTGQLSCPFAADMMALPSAEPLLIKRRTAQLGYPGAKPCLGGMELALRLTARGSPWLFQRL